MEKNSSRAKNPDSEKRLSKKIFLHISLTALLFAAFVIISCVIFVTNIANENRRSVMSELNDYANTSQTTLSMRLKNDFSTLEGITEVISNSGNLNISETDEILKQINKTNSFVRIGFADLSGKTNLVDNVGRIYPFDFNNESFFKNAVSGENSIECVANEADGKASSELRYGVPVKLNGKIAGVLIAIHSETVFTDILNLNKLSDFGYSGIIDSNGSLVLKTESRFVPNSSKTVFDLGSFSEKDKLNFHKKITGGGTFEYKSSEGEKMMAVIKPLGINDWCLLCSVNKRYITAPYHSKVIIAAFSMAAEFLLFAILIAFSIHVLYKGQKKLRETNMENSAVIKQSGKFVMRYDIKKAVLYQLGDGFPLLGLHKIMENCPDSLLESKVLLSESRESLKEFFESIKNEEPTGLLDLHIKCTDGTVRWFHADYSLISVGGEKPSCAIISMYDNTKQIEKELAYEIRQSELAAMVESSTYYMEANLMTGEIEEKHGEPINKSVLENCENNLHTIVEWDIHHSIYKDDTDDFQNFFDKNRLISLYTLGIYTDSFEFRATVDGELLWNSATVQMVKHPYTDDIKIYVIFRNVTDEHKNLEQLMGRVTDDALTGLLNREMTMESIENYLSEHGAGNIHALFMIDVDNFKSVNDTLGHQVGDGVLTSIAASIRCCFRKSDIVGRIGGDEFFAFMKNAERISVIEDKARELINELQSIYSSGEYRLDLSGSIGISVYNGNDEPKKTLNQLYYEADSALYKAKSMGKNCYAFATEKITERKESELAKTTISLNLRSLLNNLGGGIELYRGTSDGKLVPMFCNQSFLELLGGISEEEFLGIYGKDAFAGVYPEDRNELKREFYKALESRGQLQHIYRAMGKNGSYFWVTVNANFVKYNDGSYDVYAIYTDAGHLIKEKDAQKEKYKEFENYRLSLNNSIAFFKLNLTLNKCCGTSAVPSMFEKHCSGTAESFFSLIYCEIDSENCAKEFEKHFSRDALLLEFEQGKTSQTLDIPLFAETDRVMWLRLSVEMVKNPETGDIEALACFFDIDRETRMQDIMKRLINTDYEFIGQLDIKTGRLMIFGGNTELEKKLMEYDTVDYAEALGQMLHLLIEDNFFADALAALETKRLISALENTDTYICSFPTKANGVVAAGYRQWRCGYSDNLKKVIMITRTDVTKTLGNDTDILTGLYNQQGFFRHARRILDEHPAESFRLLRIDIDNFKVLNDSLGFAEGDRVLRDIGKRLKGLFESTGNQTVTARIDADHFVILCRSTGTNAEKLIGIIMNWMESYTIKFRLMAHMGEYLIEDTSLEISVMCDRALMALKSVKHNISERVGYYNESFRDKLLIEQELVSEMKTALENGQFEVWFQPQVNYDDNTYIGAEALVRWRHPKRGLISPDVFVPLFESNGLITVLDEYVWDKSCQYIRKWKKEFENFPSVSISVNISRIDIYNKNLVERLLDITSKNDVPVSFLKLEITESAYMQDPEQLMNVISDLKKAGFTLEMDDFGSGWSSLNALKDMPVDVLKLDMKFLEETAQNSRVGSILTSVIRMAHWLRITVIAEGVETKQQADYLKSLGCFYMQGYFFSHPIQPDEYENLLRNVKVGKPDRYSETNADGAAAFWDPSAQTTLLLSNLVGGAAILEYNGTSAEIVRANDKFFSEINISQREYHEKQLNTLDRFDNENRKVFKDMLEKALTTNAEAQCEVKSLPFDKDGLSFWTHNRVRMLAKTAGLSLFFLACENITERKKTEEQLHSIIKRLDKKESTTKNNK